MINLRDVSYCRLGTRDLEGAIVFATEILGLEVAERHKQFGVLQVGCPHPHPLLFRG